MAFLKPLISQTRKSRVLKKWLSLLARLLVVGCLVLAFAQPFIPEKNAAEPDRNTTVYIDNSFSMQAAGKDGPLYNTAVNDLLSNLQSDKQLTVFTNDQVFRNETKTSLTNALMKASVTAESLDLDQVQLKAQTLAEGERSDLIIMSDFQKKTVGSSIELNPEFTDFVRYSPEPVENLSIDSVYIISKLNDKIEIAVDVSANYNRNEPITLNFYNKSLLLSKTSVTLQDGAGTALFDIEIEEDLKGNITLDDNGLNFDNEIFLSYDNRQKIKILAINNTEDAFLKRIYRKDPFEFSSFESGAINYNLIKDQNLIVLNELEEIPVSLQQELNNFIGNGGKLIIIPSANASSYGSILNDSDLIMIDIEHKVSEINFDHPIMTDVFNKRINNFQYPTVQKSASIRTPNSILNFENGSSFLYERRSNFIFTAPLNNENTNFKNSPLIVPVFYNMALSSLPLPDLYNYTGTSTSIAIPQVPLNDEVFKLKFESEEFIPRQRAYSQYTEFSIENEIKTAGTYDVLYRDQALSHLAFNYPRDENQLSYFTDQELEISTSTDLNEIFLQMQEDERITELWRWFLYGALLFLICEVLILKFIK